MRRRARPIVALLVACFAAPSPARALPQRLVAPTLRPAPEDEPEAKAFAAWVEALASGRRRLSEEPPEAPRARVAAFARWGERGDGRERVAVASLLDLLDACLAVELAREQAPAPPPSLPGVPALPPAPPPPERALGEAVLQALRPFLREGGGEVARGVLALRSQPLSRRVAAAHVLARTRPKGASLALAATLASEEPTVLVAMLPALCGWPDERIDGLFARLWRAPPARESARILRLVEAHFRDRLPEPPLSGELASSLAAEAARRLGGEDWREASRALAIARAVPDELVVPPWIEALEVWTKRHLAGRQARRVQAELVRDLQRRSGRSIGAHPEGWRQWWRAVREGRIALDAGEGDAPRTVASFFGLRPSSDRLVFVLDRSGSMDAAFGAYSGTEERPGRTRYQEACAQLVGFLRASGARTRFTVILFESRCERWSAELESADERTLADLESWLRARRPGGGTELRPALERGFLGPKGFEGLEADTLIVLCDGETAEGSGWAREFARRLFDTTRVAIHCVQIGGLGDGTLQRLSSETGGDFVHVPG